MKRLFTIAILIGMSALLLSAADLSGAWKGSFDFNGSPVALTFNLKSNGDTVTGTVDGLPTSAAEIKDGKLQGDALTFYVTTDYQGSPVKLVYRGKVADDQIHFSMSTDDGSWGVDLIAKRSS